MKNLTKALLILCVIASSCNTKSNETNDDKILRADTIVANAPAARQIMEEASAEAEVPNPLFGEWVSTDDDNNVLIFTNTHRTEVYRVPGDAEKNEYQLKADCSSKQATTFNEEGDKYISLKGDDMCWYIVKIDDNNLELSMMGGRGNTLKYKKVTKPYMSIAKKGEDKMGNPTTSIRITAVDFAENLEEKADCRMLERKEFKANGIPAEANSACKCWWSGAGNSYYSIMENAGVTYYKKEEAEEIPVDKSKWELYARPELL